MPNTGFVRVMGIWLLGAGLTLTSATAVSASIKCWTNKDGVRECGNSVPPEYSRGGHERKSSEGYTLEVTARARTEAEIQAAREEKARIAKELAAAEQRAREKEEKDQALLRTFTNEDDMALAHQGKIAAIDSRIAHTEQIVGRLDEKLEGLRSKAAQLERNGRKLTPKLIDDIATLEIRRKEIALSILQRAEEKRLLEQKYQSDLERYRSLRAAN